MSTKFLAKNGAMQTTRMLILKIMISGNDFTCSEIKKQLDYVYNYRTQTNFFIYLYKLEDEGDIEIDRISSQDDVLQGKKTRSNHVYRITNQGKETYSRMKDDYIARTNRINRVLGLPTLYDTLPSEKDKEKAKAI